MQEVLVIRNDEQACVQASACVQLPPFPLTLVAALGFLSTQLHIPQCLALRPCSNGAATSEPNRRKG